jgi:hypothetical protein
MIGLILLGIMTGLGVYTIFEPERVAAPFAKHWTPALRDEGVAANRAARVSKRSARTLNRWHRNRLPHGRGSAARELAGFGGHEFDLTLIPHVFCIGGT